MKPEKKGQVVGGSIGLFIGAVAAYMIWDFNSPGGILILFGVGIGGMIGWELGKKKGAADQNPPPDKCE